MKNILQKFKENTKLKKRIIAVVSVTLAFALILSSVVVYKKSKQNIKTAEKSQNTFEETLKNEQTPENAESENLSGAVAENPENEAISESAQNTDSDSTVPNSEKTTAPTTQINISTGGSKPSNNPAPANNTKPSSQSSGQCNHSWSAYKWGNTESTYGNKYRTCSKCGKSESWRDCDHSYGAWTIRNMYVKYRTCSKCGWEDEQEGDYRSQCMGTKAEYMEFLRLVNKARKAEGLNELQYCPDSRVQNIADIRAKELTVNFSHTRPDGTSSGSMFNEYLENGGMYMANGEACYSGNTTAEGAFNSLMHSPKHRAILMCESSTHFVCARCEGYWVCKPLMKV